MGAMLACHNYWHWALYHIEKVNVIHVDRELVFFFFFRCILAISFFFTTVTSHWIFASHHVTLA